MKNKLHIFFFFVLFSLCKLSAQTNNIDFELTPAGTYTSANAVSGWTVSSQTNSSTSTSTVWTPGSPEFSIVSTPIPAFPFIGNIQHSPLGGTTVGRLNNSTANYSSTKLSRDYFVTSSNSLLQYAYAGVWQSDNNVQPWNGPSFFLKIKNQNGTELSCHSLTVTTSSGWQSPGLTFSIGTQPSSSLTVFWTNWQIKTIDLSPYMNSTITIEVISNDCVFGDHYGTLFFDADLPVTLPIVNYCAGSPSVTLTAPLGYPSYDWWIVGTGPGFQLFFPAYTRTVAFNVGSSSFTYSMLANSYYYNSQCSYSVTGIVVSAPTNIYQIKSKPSCPSGASGSATVIANAATSYSWINSTNSVVSTSSVANNLAPGTYTVNVNGCGNTSGTVTIPTSTLTLNTLLKPHCGIASILSYPGGSNYQWYYNSAPITASLGGTASSYTVNTPIGQPTYVVSYDAPNGCRDSIRTILTLTTPGALTIPNKIYGCVNAANGVGIFTVFPAAAAFSVVNSFSVYAIGTTPAYTALINPATANTFTASGLSTGGTYTIKASDGLCNYSRSFSVTPNLFNFAITPTSATVCPGGTVQANVSVTSPELNVQHTYSWSPSIFLSTSNLPYTTFTPTSAPGTTTTITYSVVVTSALANCSLTKTLSLTVANLITPTINPLPQFCSNFPQYAITVNPTGGSFISSSGSPIGTLNGILTPSLATVGVNSFTYANSVGTCIAQSSASYSVKTSPNITVSGNTVICEGQSTTLFAGGASTFTWSNSSTSPFITISPLATSAYTVKGNHQINNCSDTKIITVNVLPNPVLTILEDTTFCLGETRTLSAGGANTYNWSNGSSNSTILITPIANTAYTLQGTSALGSCTSSKIISIRVSPCTNIEKNVLSNDLSIYPNPSTGNYFIEAENILSIIVSDELGKIILEEHFQKENYQLDLSKYQNGIYILKVFHNNQIKTIKLVKTD